MTPETKYKGSLKLAAIGDALGWITEFERNTSSIEKKFATSKITSFHDWEKVVGGRFNGYVDHIKAGSYSDDTQLLLSVARSIKENGEVDQEYFSKKELPTWLMYSRGAGRTIKNAARKIERKSAKWNNNFFTFKAGKETIDYRESGANGAAMRILPIALANFGDLEKIKRQIFGNSIITHGHPRAIIGGILYGYAIDTILRFNPENFIPSNFLIELGKEIHSKLEVDFLNENAYKIWINEWEKGSNTQFLYLYKNVLNETQQYLRGIYKAIKQKEEDKHVLSLIGCFDNKTKGSGISTVVAGIFFACKYFEEPMKGIEAAVNAIGTDTDSIAAFTGGLLGALHGQSIIPARLKTVQDMEYLDEISTRLLKISEEKYQAPNQNTGESSEFVNKLENDTVELDEQIYFAPLGKGKITFIDRQKTLTSGKYNLIVDIKFDIGQSCRFSKLRKEDNIKKQHLFSEKEKQLSSLESLPDKEQKINRLMSSLNSEQKILFKEILQEIKFQ